MGYIDKAPASRINKGQVLAWAGTGTAVSTTFLSQTRHVRVISQINGYVIVEPSATQGTLMSTSTFAGGVFIAANTANGDYFAVNPGEVLTFTSSTTGTTGSSIVSIGEMT